MLICNWCCWRPCSLSKTASFFPEMSSLLLLCWNSCRLLFRNAQMRFHDKTVVQTEKCHFIISYGKKSDIDTFIWKKCHCKWLLGEFFSRKCGSAVKISNFVFFSFSSNKKWALVSIYFFIMICVITRVKERSHYWSDKRVCVKKRFCIDPAVHWTQSILTSAGSYVQPSFPSH